MINDIYIGMLQEMCCYIRKFNNLKPHYVDGL
jgi:hypothetical protein